MNRCIVDQIQKIKKKNDNNHDSDDSFAKGLSDGLSIGYDKGVRKTKEKA